MKKIKLLLSTIALFAFLNTANAQQLEQEIISFVDDTEILINNGRRMMLHYVQARNFERVAEVYHFLNERTSERYCVVFAFHEEIHIAALINNWDDFFAIVRDFDDIERMTLCVPLQDHSLFNALLFEVRTNASQIFENAQAVGLTPEETQLLELYFYVLEHGADEAYRQKIRAFRRQHPESIYNDFIRNRLPRAPIRGGMGFNFGASQLFPTGRLSDYFAPTTAFYFAWDFIIDRIYFGIQGNFASMRLNSPLLSSATGYYYDFLEGDRLYYEDFMFSLGYVLRKSDRFHITPFIGLGGTYLGKRNRSDREFAVVNSFTITPGLRTEFHVARFNLNDPVMGSISSSVSLRLEAGYMMPTRFRYTPAQGNMFYARAGIVWWLGNI